MKAVCLSAKLAGLVLLLFTACRPDDLAWNLSDQRVPIVQTNWYELTDTGARTHCSLRLNGGSEILSLGVVYGTESEPTSENEVAWVNPSVAQGFLFFVDIDNLEPGREYFVRAFAENATGVGYGGELSFTTVAVPRLSTLEPSSITDVSFHTGGLSLDDNGYAISQRGLLLTTSLPFNVNTATEVIVEPSESDNFEVTAAGLNPATTYYVRAFARNSLGIGVGEVFEVTTLDAPIIQTLDVVQTPPGNIVFEGVFTGGAALNIEQMGFVYAQASNPTLEDGEVVTVSITQGQFVSGQISGLSENNMYFVRTFLQINGFIYYGNELAFISETTAPTVGAYYAGGIVAYFFQEGDAGYVSGESHGIIILPFDLTSPGGGLVPWGCSDQLYGTQGIEIGQGVQNTTALIEACANNTNAAYLCAVLTWGGYSDWFLPSIGELVVIRNGLIDHPSRDFLGEAYWSSTEVNITVASAFNFVTGSAVQTNKVAQRSVFAARYF